MRRSDRGLFRTTRTRPELMANRTAWFHLGPLDGLTETTRTQIDPSTLEWLTTAATDPGDGAHLYIYNEIGVFGVTAEDMIAALADVDSDVLTVHLRSPGGDARDGVAIFNALRDHPARIITKVDALAASAASIIAMAGDERIMNRASEMMVHNAMTFVHGTADDMRTAVEMLDRVNANMAEVYATRAGGTIEGWLEAMDRTAWFTAAEAVDAGLAHSRVTDTPDGGKDDAGATWDLSIYAHATRAEAGPPYIPSADPDPDPDPDPVVETSNGLTGLVDGWTATNSSTDNNPFAGLLNN